MAEVGVDEVSASDLIATGSTELKGWTISYRKSQPERRSFHTWRIRWSRNRQKYLKHRIPLQLGQARPYPEQTLRKQERWKANWRKEKPA